MNYGPYYPPTQYPGDPRDMYIYDDSFVVDEGDGSKVVSELKKINKTLESIEKKVKKIEQKMEQRFPQQQPPYYY